jgi:CHAD domain-containing protein
MSTKAVMTALRAASGIVAGRPVASRRTYLDTADWRVNAGGWTLVVETAEPQDRRDGSIGVTATLEDGLSEVVVAVARLSCVPRYAADLPKVAPWSDIASLIEGRRLLSQAEMESRIQRVAVLNSDGKTTARIQFARHVVRGDSTRRHVARMATVTAIRSYERIAERLAKVLEGIGLEPHDEPLLPVALRWSGRPQPGAKLGPGVALERSMRAADAFDAVLQRLRYHVVSNELGVRQQLDTEFLHEYRVAIRRGRSILRQGDGVLSPVSAKSLAAELGWLGSVTSPPRDLDVHIEQLGSSEGPEMDPLRDYLISRRQSAQRDLMMAIDSPRYAQLLVAWQKVGDPDPEEGSLDAVLLDADLRAGDVADAHIRRAYRRVLRRGRAIDELSPAEALHDLRKRAKELRYLLECFQTLYPPDERGPVIKELKALQDNLGEFQDCQVQAAALRTMAEELLQAGAAPAATLMAMGRLARDQERREARARDEFASRFARFASQANRERFATLLRAGRVGELP